MLDPSDYKEPSCPLSGGREFYYPDKDKDRPLETIPIQSIIRRLDEILNREEYEEANRLLLYWLNDSAVMNDRRGELSILNELLGLSRRRNDSAQGLSTVRDCMNLIDELGLTGQISSATILLNAATTLKCFGKPEEALPIYEKVQKIYQDKLSSDDPLYAGLLNNMALTLTDLGKFSEALSCFTEAVSIMKEQKNGQADAAISFCNMAELFEKEYPGDENTSVREEKINSAMENAWTLLNDPSLERNGYYAFVCRKCASGFGYYGFFAYRKELDRRADEIYRSNGKNA